MSVSRESVEKIASELGVQIILHSPYITMVIGGKEYTVRGFRKAYQRLYDYRRRK